MTVVKGDIRLVTNEPAAVSQVWVRAPKPRTQGLSYVSESSDTVQVDNGVVEFTVLPGAAVMVLVQNGVPTDTVKLIVPDKETASLRECIDAVGLVDDGTLSALEELALETAGTAAQIASAGQLDTWANETASAAAQARLDRNEANRAANRAATHESNAKNAESNSKQHEESANSAAQAASGYAASAANDVRDELSDIANDAQESATQAKTSETNAKMHEDNSVAAAERAEFAAEETIQQVEGDFATRNYVDALGWKQGKIPLNANLDTWLNDGDFEIDTYAVATSLTGRPSSITGTIGAAHFRQFTSQAGHKTQLWEAYGNAISPAVRVSRAKFGDYWQPWTKIADSTDLAKVHIRRGAISSGANLNEWSQDGSFDIASYAIASSLVGRPSGDALGAADFQQTTTDTGHKTQRWVRIQGDTGTPIELVRTKGKSAGAFTDWVPTTPTVNNATWKRTDTIHMWGDSAVADKLAAELNSVVSNTVANRGGWGWTSNDVLLRAGIIQLSGVPVGGSIPASGDVQIDLLGQQFTTRPARTISASWAGIPGELIHQQDETWIFRRTTAGAAVPISTATPVISNDSGLTVGGTHIFLFAGNDILADAGHAPDSNLEDHIVANYQRAIEAVSANPIRHVLIGGVKSKATDGIGSLEHQLTVAVNDRLRLMYPGNFVDREAWLASRGMAAAGLTPSAEDQDKMEAGMAPAGTMYDHTHVKPEVVAVEAAELWAKALIVRGWA